MEKNLRDLTKDLLELRQPASSILDAVRSKVNSHMVRGNVFAQNGFFLTKEWKKELANQASKLDLPAEITKALEREKQKDLETDKKRQKDGA